MTKDQLRLLSRYRRETPSIQLPPIEAKELEALGLVSWQPPIFGTHNLYYLTEAGRKVCEQEI